ncbi:MAG: (Fe-S)-binding protein [Acidimicrobiales bacterium]
MTCMNNILYPETGRAVVTVLERLGHEVDFIESQTCCGQMHLNAGYRPEGLKLARDVMDSFERADVVVVPSGSCTSTMRHLWRDVAQDENDDQLVADADAFAPKVFEFTELLVDVLGVTDVGATFERRVTYHPTCHSLRSLRVGDRPLKLLREVRGIELIELPESDSCCGFGGLFAVKNPDTSAAMGLDKIARVLDTGADVLCASDNSCLTHLATLAKKSGSLVPGPSAASTTPPTFEVRHIAEILASTGRATQ